MVLVNQRRSTSCRGGGGIFTLAHISDLHGTPVAPKSPVPLLGKRGLGWLSWRLRRRYAHRPEVLEALLRDLTHTAPDHVVITGDLTNVSLESEFPAAREWLRRIGPPDRVTAVPGNHDAYVRVPEARSWSLWSEYLVSDAEGAALLAELTGREQTREISFPSLRFVQGVAIVGLCSALPTPALWASGTLGAEQIIAFESVLDELGSRGLARVVLLHHPPAPGSVTARRALTDAQPLCAALCRAGAELVLHGHLHRTRIGSVPGPQSEIPVVGVRSASHAGTSPIRIARYHLFEIEPGNPRARITMKVREFDAEDDAFRGVDAPLPLPA